MSVLFSPYRVGSLELRNRIVIAPMCQYSAAEDCATDWHIIHLGNLALSGAALLIVEATAVLAEGRIRPDDLGLWSERAEVIVGTGDAYFIAVARAILYDPRWPWHAAAHLGARVKAPKQYLRCQPHQYRQQFDD